MDTIKLQNIEEIKVNNTKNTVIRYIFMVCGALILLLALFRLMMGDGIAALSGLPGFFVSWYIASRFRGAESFIEKVNTEIEFGDGYITFIYTDIDRGDGKGVHREMYRYNANCVKAFEYKKDLESLRVEGIVNIREEHVDGTVKIIGGNNMNSDGSVTKADYNFVLCLYDYDDAMREEVRCKAEEALKRPVAYV